MIEVKIFTIFDRPETVPTEPGNMFLDVFQEEIKKDGSHEIVPIGKKNIYEMIQADLESTKIENILHALAMGDLQALQQREAMYFDATTMPKNLMEVENLVCKAKQEFESFPLEVKELFNHSADQYVAEMGTKEFFDKMSPYNKKMADIEAAGSAKEYEKKVAAQAKFESDVAAARGGNE